MKQLLATKLIHRIENKRYKKRGEDIMNMGFDAYAPKEIAEKVDNVGVTKCNGNFWAILMLAILAGAFIALGAEFSTLVIHDANTSVGYTKWIGGITFTLGLLLVVCAGAELFTGNTLAVMAFVSKKITGKALLRNWVIVYVGNLIGSLIIVGLMFLSEQYTVNNSLVGAKVLSIAAGKANLSWTVAFVRGILCNTLVCLAVWLSFGGRNVIDKLAAMLLPVSAFVASGFEHSVANMYFIPIGLLLKNVPGVASVANIPAEKLANLTVSGAIYNNLIPVTLGNIVGGGIFVGLVYWFIYLRDTRVSGAAKTPDYVKTA